jgi:hypothetical protein
MLDAAGRVRDFATEMAGRMRDGVVGAGCIASDGLADVDGGVTESLADRSALMQPEVDDMMRTVDDMVNGGPGSMFDAVDR